jgi:hypothetical protein
MTYSAEQKLSAVRRELEYRRRVYARAVAEGRMARQFADWQIKIFEEIAADYEPKAEGERLI